MRIELFRLLILLNITLRPNNNNNKYLYSALFTLCSNALLKNTVITLLNIYRTYTNIKRTLHVFTRKDNTSRRNVGNNYSISINNAPIV